MPFLTALPIATSGTGFGYHSVATRISGRRTRPQRFRDQMQVMIDTMAPKVLVPPRLRQIFEILVWDNESGIERISAVIIFGTVKHPARAVR